MSWLFIAACRDASLDFKPDLAAANVGTPSAEILDNQAKAIRRAGGLPIAAHPNLTYALTAQDIVNSDRTSGPRFFEVWNTEPGINNLGGGGKPSTEQIWDQALSTGRVVYGVGVDDSHHFYTMVESRRLDEPLSNPGRAWIMVRASELTWDALRAAMERATSTPPRASRCWTTRRVSMA